MTDRDQFPTNDFQRRLLNNGGPIPGERGLYPQNLRRAPREPRAPIDGTADAISRLVAALRDMTNLNVRQPSHLAPPYRAQAFTWQAAYSVAGGAGNASPLVVTFNGNETVPQGMNAVVSWWYVTCNYRVDTAVAARVDLWSAFGFTTLDLNGSPVPGYANIRPATTTGVMEWTQQAALGDTIAGVMTANIPFPPMTAPINLKPLDRLSIFYDNATAGVADAYMTFQVAGYMYPQELTADGVRGTLADRG